MKDNKSNIFYVYGLINPLNDQFFYIGYGQKDRSSSHWKNFLLHGFDVTAKGYNFYKCVILQSIKDVGLKPIEKILFSNLSIDKASILEAGLIRKFGMIWNNTGILTNIVSKRSQSPASNPEIAKKISIGKSRFFKTSAGQSQLQQYSDSMKLRWQNQSFKNNHSGKVKSFYQTEKGIELKNKLSQIHKGKKISDEHKKSASKLNSNLRWINNGNENKRVTKFELYIYLLDGWIHGRIMPEQTKTKKSWNHAF